MWCSLVASPVIRTASSGAYKGHAADISWWNSLEWGGGAEGALGKPLFSSK